MIRLIREWTALSVGNIDNTSSGKDTVGEIGEEPGSSWPCHTHYTGANYIPV